MLVKRRRDLPAPASPQIHKRGARPLVATVFETGGGRPSSMKRGRHRAPTSPLANPAEIGGRGGGKGFLVRGGREGEFAGGRGRPPRGTILGGVEENDVKFGKEEAAEGDSGAEADGHTHRRDLDLHSQSCI